MTDTRQQGVADPRSIEQNQSMITESLAIAKTAFSAFRKPFKVGVRKARISIFRMRTKQPPLDDAKAKQIAYSVLAGDVIQAKAYRNIDSGHVFIACLRQSSERDYDHIVYVLEQIGNTFRVVWKSDRLFGSNPGTLEVPDVDNDGNCEVIFEDHSFGTGGGTMRLMIYSSQRNCLLTVTESLNWQDLAGPCAPEIKIEPTSTPEVVSWLEGVARKRGFLRPGLAVDFEDPNFALQRWHKENGKMISGQVRLHHYPGYPRYKASVVAVLETGTVLWLAFFKGPLFGYERLNDRHFIAYSPAWFYNWAKCLAFDGERLWFGVHCRNGLMSFRPADNNLECYESFQNESLPEVEKLAVDRGVLILNERLNIPIKVLTKVHSQ